MTDQNEGSSAARDFMEQTAQNAERRRDRLRIAVIAFVAGLLGATIIALPVAIIVSDENATAARDNALAVCRSGIAGRFVTNQRALAQRELLRTDADLRDSEARVTAGLALAIAHGHGALPFVQKLARLDNTSARYWRYLRTKILYIPLDPRAAAGTANLNRVAAGSRTLTVGRVERICEETVK